MDGEAAQKNTASDGRGNGGEGLVGRLFEQEAPAYRSLCVSFPKFRVVILESLRIEAGRNDGFESSQQNASIIDFFPILPSQKSFVAVPSLIEFPHYLIGTPRN